MNILMRKEARQLTTMKNRLTLLGINWVAEYKFDEKRRFRFDIALPELKIAIEYEGIFAEKSRHTSLGGYSTDCEKYNLAAINGWRMLRYTALNYEYMAGNILKIIKKQDNDNKK